MTALNRFLSLGILLGAALLAGCSKTVSWEEEVPLNTGEVITVKRSGVYRYQGLTSDGSHFRYVPELRSTIEFAYRGKRYAHAGDASIQLIAIAPDSVPHLLADARGWGNQNGYPCITPYYVQFKPDESGKKWTWPVEIEKWLYKLPTNLVIGVVPIQDDGTVYKPADREQKNVSLTAYAAHYHHVDPNFKPENCMRKN